MEVKKLSPLEEYEANREKARAFCMEAVEYDYEDAVCLDNLGQFFYRVCGDPAAAKEWFDKAIAVKPGQIDTLWFLSRYDLEAGNKEAAFENILVKSSCALCSVSLSTSTRKTTRRTLFSIWSFFALL